ncbi:MAG: hypothetical protein D6678_03745 [Zetaproteobacteria bacterium]|nr:MAG: hypothetical protein D6678_03745 [Zetaproteobacteria bacterium]
MGERVLLAHGSPDARHGAALRRLARDVGARLGCAVRHATLDDALPTGAHVLPLLLTEGRHGRCDAPASIARAAATRVDGPAERPAEIADLLLAEVQRVRARQRAVMFVVYRFDLAESLVAELYRVSKQFPLPAIAAVHGGCDVASVLALWRAEGVRDVLIQPALLFPGITLDALRAQAACPEMCVHVGTPLYASQAFVAWIARRFKEET